MQRSGNLHAEVTFTSGKRGHNIHWMGGYVVPRAIMNIAAKRKISVPLPESEPQSETLLTVTAHDKISKYICFLVSNMFHSIS
jgi:hypothetical protein